MCGNVQSQTQPMLYLRVRFICSLILFVRSQIVCNHCSFHTTNTMRAILESHRHRYHPLSPTIDQCQSRQLDGILESSDNDQLISGHPSIHYLHNPVLVYPKSLPPSIGHAPVAISTRSCCTSYHMDRLCIGLHWTGYTMMILQNILITWYSVLRFYDTLLFGSEMSSLANHFEEEQSLPSRFTCDDIISTFQLHVGRELLAIDDISTNNHRAPTYAGVHPSCPAKRWSGRKYS